MTSRHQTLEQILQTDLFALGEITGRHGTIADDCSVWHMVGSGSDEVLILGGARLDEVTVVVG